jgi:hypothetical protein
MASSTGDEKDCFQHESCSPPFQLSIGMKNASWRGLCWRGDMSKFGVPEQKNWAYKKRKILGLFSCPRFDLVLCFNQGC